jgi:DNA polymerase-3 subunit delta
MASAQPAGQKSIRAAMQSGAFEPAYYLHGDEEFLKDDMVRQLVEAAVDPATRDFNLEFVRGAEVSAESLGSLLGTPPMMAERRVVVVRDVPALKKDARSALEKYLNRPAPDVLLLLVAPAGAKADKVLESRTRPVEFEPLTGDRIPRWISYYAEHDLGTSITPEAAALLQDAVGSELPQLKLELDKLANYAGAGAIDENAVVAVVGVRPGETMSALLDAVVARDAAAALSLLPGVLQQPKVNAVQIVMALSTHMLCIGWASAARDRGVSASRLSGELFTVLKTSGSVYSGRSWGEMVTCCVRGSEHWGGRDVDAALDALLNADAALKGTRMSNDEQLLANLILTLCGLGRRRRAA